MSQEVAAHLALHFEIEACGGALGLGLLPPATSLPSASMSAAGWKRQPPTAFAFGCRGTRSRDERGGVLGILAAPLPVMTCPSGVCRGRALARWACAGLVGLWALHPLPGPRGVRSRGLRATWSADGVPVTDIHPAGFCLLAAEIFTPAVVMRGSGYGPLAGARGCSPLRGKGKRHLAPFTTVAEGVPHCGEAA